MSGAASYASERPVQRPVQRPVPFVSSFLHDLASGLVLIFVLGLCLTLYVFYASLYVFLEVLIIGSSRRLHPSHILHPIKLQNNYLQIHLSNLVVLVIKH